MIIADLEQKQRFINKGNVYLPHIVIVDKIIEETPAIRTIRFHFKEEQLNREFKFRAGQFAELSVFGVGEATFCICSSPTRNEFWECCINRVGLVTDRLHKVGVGAELGFRGPYGNDFPVEAMEGKNIIFIGGGIGLAPLRSLIWNVMDNRNKFGNIAILYGARSSSDLCFKYDINLWTRDKSIKTILTVDKADKDWTGKVGMVPVVLKELAPSADNAIAVVCGPPVMIRNTFPVLEEIGFKPEDIFTTLEKKMKCGIGKCGRCNIGNIYVCRDGPVFTYAQIKKFISDEY